MSRVGVGGVYGLECDIILHRRETKANRRARRRLTPHTAYTYLGYLSPSPHDTINDSYHLVQSLDLSNENVFILIKSSQLARQSIWWTPIMTARRLASTSRINRGR